MRSKHLVIFDIDGTLFQTDCVTVPAVQQAFMMHGLRPPTREEICAFFGRPVEAYEAWLAGLCPLGLADEIVEETNALELQFIGEHGKLYPDTWEVLSYLAEQGYDFAVCSNGPEPYVQEVLRAHDLDSFFSEVYARDTRYEDKTEMTGLILASLRPDKFAVVGDRRDDLEAAHAHGGFGIAAGYGFGSPGEWCEADAVANSVREIPACIEILFRL